MAVTIAFNTPLAIDWLAESLAAHAPHIALVVCDNSSDPEARAAIAALCAKRGVAYLSMPRVPVPLQRNPSRSHGFAMTWAFHNVVRPLAPAAFAFLDHDLVLTAPVSLAGLVRSQPVYGLLADHPEWGTWALWGGYAVFDFAAVGQLPLDFGTYHTMGLDSGGRNWPVLYRQLDRSGFSFARHRWEQVRLGDGETTDVEMIDAWMHVGEVSHRPQQAERLRFLSAKMRGGSEPTHFERAGG